MNKIYNTLTRYRTFRSINEQTRPIFMFVHLNKRTKFLVCVRLFNKRTNTNELPAGRFTNCSPNIWFVGSPSCEWRREKCYCSSVNLEKILFTLYNFLIFFKVVVSGGERKYDDKSIKNII
ncbi:hypothetical protein Hanom_Chr04g00384491 [Helianthus anomalus]